MNLQNNTIYFLWDIKLLSFIINAMDIYIYIYIFFFFFFFFMKKFYNNRSDLVSGEEKLMDSGVLVVSITQIKHFNNYEIYYETSCVLHII